MTTPLADKLRAQIAADGPMSVRAYMHACLHDPDHGYYRSQKAIGREADFVTAPEISQVFGELIGVWTLAAWQGMGQPERPCVVELGPGRGSLMADALRSFRLVPDFAEQVSLHLVETNTALTEVQRSVLAPVARSAAWHETLEGVPAGPTVLIANEFLDVLPVRQFVFRDGSWVERMVDLDGDGAFVLIDGVFGAPGCVPDHIDAKDGDVFEASDGFEQLAAELAKRTAFVGLFIDYGHLRSGIGDTLQAVRGHSYTSIFDQPGASDLTAHVDFEAFARAAASAGLAITKPLEQNAFLLRLGISERAEVLAASATLEQRNDLELAIARLMAPDGMGGRFKVMAVHSPDLPCPFPFEVSSIK